MSRAIRLYAAAIDDSTGTRRTGWPFWAATSDEGIDRALSLAAVREGDRLLDLGCGDGRVLLRAATVHGAAVAGVELDPALAASARELLRTHGVDGTVMEADFDTVPIDADVVFAYLSPATLQRLRPILGACPAGTRLVTTGYPVPGWEADEADGRCYLYRLPATEADVDGESRGWASAGVLVSVRPDAPSLVAVKLHHGGGPVAVSISGAGFSEWVAVRTGADTAAPGTEVIVDIRFDSRPAGTLAAGTLDVPGEPPFHVFAVVDDGEPGVWGLSASGCGVIGRALAGGNAASVLAAVTSFVL
jgi:SAM-dependent methyltransferase